MNYVIKLFCVLNHETFATFFKQNYKQTEKKTDFSFHRCSPRSKDDWRIRGTRGTSSFAVGFGWMASRSPLP